MPGVRSSLWIPALSPFVAVAGVMAPRRLFAIAWLGIAVGIVVLMRRRFFCRWVCPMGLCLDGAGWLGRRWRRRPGRVPLLGPWIVLLTLGGACLGYPFLLWLDPLAIFTGVFVAGERSLGYSVWPVAGFAAVFLLSAVWPHSWCGRVCPLGAFQDMLYEAPRSLRRAAGREVTCQDVMNADNGLSRRLLLGAAFGAGTAGITRLVGNDRPRPLRPPNARKESLFVGLCTRCGNCLRSCPSGIIQRDIGEYGWASLWTPVLSFQNGYCQEACTECTEVCPSGAIPRLSIADKGKICIGLPRVNMDICLLADNRECSACARWCPYDAIRYRWCETEYAVTPEIDPHKCNGCGACEAVCPTRPDRAIVVLPM